MDNTTEIDELNELLDMSRFYIYDDNYIKNVKKIEKLKKKLEGNKECHLYEGDSK